MSDYSGEVVELEVARYGLRTFRHIPAEEAVMDHSCFSVHQQMRMTLSLLGIGDDSQNNTGKPMELCSTAMHGSYWKGGVCEATCQAPVNAHEKLLIELAALTTGVEPFYGHRAPQEDCHCGVYAAHTLQVLRDQFTGYVDNIVAVVAAEGQTIIGDKGFRTERARVVAYWCSESVAATAESQFPDAERYFHVSPMLDYYGLERGAPSSAPDRYAWGGGYVVSSGGGGGGATLTFGWEPSANPLEKVQAISNRAKMWTLLNLSGSAVNFSAYFLWNHHLVNLVAAVVALAVGIISLVIGAIA